MTGDITKDLQVCRLLIMMYRQGWLDASLHLSMEAKRQADKIKQDYERLWEAT